MILRRFMKHVTDQNWFAVGLDVLVVIVGIVLGLQVQEWNVERREASEEIQYLTRLHDDITDSINQNNFRVEFMGRQQLYTSTMIDDLSNCYLPPENEYAFTNGLYTIGKVLPAVLSRTVLDELNSTGKTLVIKSVALRKALAEHAVLIDEAVDIDNKIIMRTGPHVSAVENKFTYNLARAHIGAEDIEIGEVIFDFETLCKDKEFSHSLSLILAYNFDEQARSLLAIKQQNAIKVMIEMELEKKS